MLFNFIWRIFHPCYIHTKIGRTYRFGLFFSVISHFSLLRREIYSETQIKIKIFKKCNIEIACLRQFHTVFYRKELIQCFLSIVHQRNLLMNTEMNDPYFPNRKILRN